MAKVSIDGLAAAVAKELAEYSQDVADGVKNEVKQVAKEMVQELKQTSPRDTGKYAAGWREKTEFESDEDIRKRVYNAKKPQLTHLLENGHAKKNGGRVNGKPHIRLAEQTAEKKLTNGVKVVVRG